VRPQALRSGSLSASALRMWAAIVAAVAVALRLGVHFSSGRSVPAPPAAFGEYLGSADHIWSAPPLPGLILSVAHLWREPANLLIAIELVAVVTVVGLLVRLGERWLDYRVGLLAAAAWALCGPALAVFRVPGSEGWQAALSILCAAAMLRVARRRAPLESWRIGMSAGVLTLFSGGGVLWAVAGAAWLPVTSRKFRGRQWFVLAGLILAGWMVVVAPVAVRNAVLSGGDPVLPVTDGVERFYVAMVEPTLASGSDAEARILADAALARAGVDAGASAWTRSTKLVSLALDSGGAGWGGAAKRFVALLGGWLPEHESPNPGIAWWWLTLAAWVGVVALLPGTRFLFPLLLGGLIPLLRGMFGGVDPGTALSATPFVCLYAGYGVWRVVTGRRSPVTWIATAIVLLVAALVHASVRGWS
jgi:hypothetical protein